jgi:uncharacterized membrane protein YtjA (UPF0391 family)
MIGRGLFILILAFTAAIFGFIGLAGLGAVIAQIIFWFLLVLFVILVVRRLRH